MSRPEEEPTLDIAHGDPALSRHLRESLKLLRDRSDDAEFERLVDDVLHGRRSLREVAFTPAFTQALNPGVEQFAQRYEQLSDEERAELAAQGEDQLSEQRAAIEQERRDADEHTDADDDPDEWDNPLR